MVDEAIKSLQALFFASVLILALWLLSWPASSEKLRLYRAAVDLQAWVDMRERLSTLKIDVFTVEPGEDITEDLAEGNPKPPNYEPYDLPVPLQLNLTWPVQQVQGFHLTPAGFSQNALAAPGESARVYRIVTGTMQLPLGDYYAIFLKDTKSVLEKGRVIDRERTRLGLVPTDYRLFKNVRSGIRQVTSALENENRPKRWGEIKLHLARFGFSGEPATLSSRDGALVRLQAEEDPRLPSGGVSIFGIQLSVAQFFSAVGILLAAVSFAMVGPLLSLRSSPARRHSQAWVLVIPKAGTAPRLLLEWMICVVTMLWALLPVLILSLQLKVYPALAAAGWLFYFGSIGLIVSSITYGFVAWELRLTRVAAGLSA